jgi:glycosyltransferase involved in cell wall biosynthesis
MNILFLDQFSDLGGAQRCLLELLPAVREHGWQANVAAPGDGALRERVLELGAGYHAIRCQSYHSGRKSLADVLHFARDAPRLAREIANLAENCRADILYVNGPRLLPAVRLAVLKFTGRVSIVFHCHSYLARRYAAALANLSLAGANATIIANSKFVTGPLSADLKANIVYNGVEIPDHPRAPVTAVRRIGMLGRIAPEKGQLEFVQAARRLPREYQFVICGAPLFSDPAAASYSDQVRECAGGLPVEFIDWRNDPGSVLSGLDLLVVPSKAHEATTRVILEAYAAGVPVVASNCGGIAEIVSDGETGFLTPPADPVRLAAKISELASNPTALQRAAGAARRVVQERYTLRQYQDRVMSILATVGSRARA